MGGELCLDLPGKKAELLWGKKESIENEGLPSSPKIKISLAWLLDLNKSGKMMNFPVLTKNRKIEMTFFLSAASIKSEKITLV